MKSLPIFPDRYTSKEAAEILGVQNETLAVWRCTKRYALPYYKIGRQVFYREKDLIAFIESRFVEVEAV